MNNRALAELLALTAIVNGPYSAPFPKLKGINRKRFEDCPICKAKRRTLYYKSGHWACLKCAEAALQKEAQHE